MILLKRFSRNIQRKVGRVNKTLDEAEVIGKKIGALIHNQNAVRIKLQAFFIAFCIIIKRSVRRNEQQSVVGYLTLGL